MRLTVSDARSQLGHLVTRVQDPRTEVILTRHGKPVAALVSITEVRRIWDLQDTERNGWWWPLYRIRRGGGILRTSWDLVPGRDGKMVTRREAALQ
ncbi:MAG: type II toxin-antitoxin system Phd/YefM family antitoxin, partial [Pseudomonadota bacterium]